MTQSFHILVGRNLLRLRGNVETVSESGAFAGEGWRTIYEGMILLTEMKWQRLVA
jgi:hypothetical protein